jgi:hypothetical protein
LPQLKFGLKVFESLNFESKNFVSKSENSLCSQPKTCFGLHGPRPLLQPAADCVRAAKALPPNGHGRCPAASPISLSSQIVAQTVSPPFPCLQSRK